MKSDTSDYGRQPQLPHSMDTSGAPRCKEVIEPDPDILNRLDDCAKKVFDGVVHRVVRLGESPVHGRITTRGRWNSPTRRFRVRNTSLERDGASKEFKAYWSQFEQKPVGQASSYSLWVNLKSVVELDFRILDELGVRKVEYGERKYSRTREISNALSFLGCDGLIVPSARYDGKNLVIYLDNLDEDSPIKEIACIDFAWFEKTV